jgi:curved DNA-binding protein CbpA
MAERIPDYYKTLGVARDASTDTIKTTFRQLARQYHPDANVGRSEAEIVERTKKFKTIAAAYERLADITRDSEARARYDASLQAQDNATTPTPEQTQQAREEQTQYHQKKQQTDRKVDDGSFFDIFFRWQIEKMEFERLQLLREIEEHKIKEEEYRQAYELEQQQIAEMKELSKNYFADSLPYWKNSSDKPLYKSQKISLDLSFLVDRGINDREEQKYFGGWLCVRMKELGLKFSYNEKEMQISIKGMKNIDKFVVEGLYALTGEHYTVSKKAKLEHLPWDSAEELVVHEAQNTNNTSGNADSPAPSTAPSIDSVATASSDRGWQFQQQGTISILTADQLPEGESLDSLSQQLRSYGIRNQRRPDSIYITGKANVERLQEWLESPEPLPLPEEHQNAATEADTASVSPPSSEFVPQASEPAVSPHPVQPEAAPSSSLRIDDLLPESEQETATGYDGYTLPPLDFIRERTERRGEKYLQQDAAISSSPPASAAPSAPPPPVSTQRRETLFWKKAALAVTAAALAISTTVMGFLGAQKIHQTFSPSPEPPAPAPEHVQKAPASADILDTARHYQNELTILQNMGGAALAEKPDATPLQKAVATATSTLYQTIDQQTGAAADTTRNLFDAAAQRRDATKTVFEQAEQDTASPQSTRGSNQNVFVKAWEITRNTMVSIASAVGINRQKTDEQALMGYMKIRDRERS